MTSNPRPLGKAILALLEYLDSINASEEERIEGIDNILSIKSPTPQPREIDHDELLAYFHTEEGSAWIKEQLDGNNPFMEDDDDDDNDEPAVY